MLNKSPARAKTLSTIDKQLTGNQTGSEVLFNGCRAQQYADGFEKASISSEHDDRQNMAIMAATS
jgi:hypothetical protein